MNSLPTKYIAVAIDRPVAAVYDFLKVPANFPQWASGLGGSFVALGKGDWRAATPMGPMTLRFTPENPYGIVDHAVIPDGGEPMMNPMRVFANADGCEVVFTLFRRPGMSESDFARDADWVRRDLLALKNLMET